MKKFIKSGFTMIELIFVIVIIAILAAVALPKFAGAGKEAHVSNLKQFEGSLNRTVLPSAWQKVVGQGGSLTKLSSDESNLTIYTNIPKSEFPDLANADLSKTISDGSDLSKYVPDKCGSSDGKWHQVNDGNNDLKSLKFNNSIFTYAICDGTPTTSPESRLLESKDDGESWEVVQ